MKLFVLGATGATGTALVDEAVAAGHEVTAYVRNPDKMVRRPGLNVVAGQLTDGRLLASTATGVDAVISTLGNGRGKTDKTLMTDASHAILGAAATAGVKRVIVLSAFGVGESLPKASWLGRLVYKRVLGEVFADKARGEEEVMASDLDWTIVYSVTLTDGPGGGDTVTSTLGETPKLSGMPKVSRADVASFLLDIAVDGGYRRQIVVLRPRV